MSATTAFTAEDIARAMASKARDAFGHSVTHSFTVEDIQQHRADLHYTVNATYSGTYVSRPVSYATGPLYERYQLQDVFDVRLAQLLATPDLLRSLMQAKLVENPSLYREPSKQFLTSDTEVCCILENCQGCGGVGTEFCISCGGRSWISCGGCHGSLNVSCTGCSGTGRSTHVRHCGHCSGTGSFLNNRCGACSGTGLSGHPCYVCSASGRMTCDTCNGRGDVQCHRCNHGQVTCGICNGAQQLIYEYHLDLSVETKVSYRWDNLTAGWMSKSLTEFMNTPQRHAVFRVDRYQTSDDPSEFTATGHVVAAQARVTYQGTSGTCHFIGPSLLPVHLDGVLNGEFKKTLAGVTSHQDVKKVVEASNSKVARELIKEVAKGTDITQTSPVRKGIIDAGDAQRLIETRDQSVASVIDTSRKFRWKAVFWMSGKLFRVLVCLYALMGILTRGTPPFINAHEGVLGLFEVGKLFTWQAHPLAFMIFRAMHQHNLLQIVCWVVAGMLFNRFVLWLIAPRLWYWAQVSLLRLTLASAVGMVLLDFFMTLNPSAFVDLSFTTLIPSIHMNATHIVSQVFVFALVKAPQIYILSLVVSLALYKVAGIHWGVRNLQELKPGHSEEGYLKALKAC